MPRETDVQLTAIGDFLYRTFSSWASPDSVPEHAAKYICLESMMISAGPILQNQRTRQPARLSNHCTTARTIKAFRPSTALVAQTPVSPRTNTACRSATIAHPPRKASHNAPRSLQKRKENSRARSLFRNATRLLQLPSKVGTASAEALE